MIVTSAGIVWCARRYMELNLKSTIAAVDCQQSLKTIREDLNVRIMEPGENPSLSLID